MSYDNVVIIGYHEIACTLLDEMLLQGFNIKAVVPNHKRNNQESSWYRDLSELAMLHSIPVIQVSNLNDKKFLDFLKKSNIDIIFSGFSSKIFPKELIEIPKLGCFNFHNSDLPKYKGRAAPIWALINGESKIAMTLHCINESIDGGNIIAKEYIDIMPEDDIRRIYLKCNFAQLKILRQYLSQLKTGNFKSIQQDVSTTKYSWDDNVNNLIDFTKMRGKEIYNLVRALTYPFPGARVINSNGDLRLFRVDIRADLQRLNLTCGTIINIDNNFISIKCLDSILDIYDISFDGRHLLPIHYCYLFSLKEGDILGN